MLPAVFLDRDNTLIHNDEDLGDPAGVVLIQGAASAVASFRGLGFKVVVVTNQGGVARGKYTEADVEAVHERINELVRHTTRAWIDRFYYCPFHPDAVLAPYRREHPWRKPQPGMLLQASRDLDIDLAHSWMIGDQPRDVAAGLAAGCRTILLDPSAPEFSGGPSPLASLLAASTPANQVTPHFVARSLTDAARIIAQQRRPDAQDQADRDTIKPTPHTARQSTPPTPSKPGPSGPDSAPSPAVDPDQHPPHLLRAILSELRQQRAHAHDFSAVQLLALILQMIAIVCLMGGLWMGQSEPQILRWLGGAVVLQLASIGALLLRR